MIKKVKLCDFCGVEISGEKTDENQIIHMELTYPYRSAIVDVCPVCSLRLNAFMESLKEHM